MEWFGGARLYGGSMWLGVCVLIHGCVTPPEGGKKETPRDLDRRTQLAEIQKTYAPIACFAATFRLSLVAAGRSQEANGSLRVDNGKQRMQLTLTHTILPITISRLTVRDGTAYIDNPYGESAHRRAEIPVDRFAVSGLGSNSIVLPFRLFQDLLYARLPPDVFAPRADLKKIGPGQIIVALDSPYETYRYGFTENRLRTLEYTRKESGDEVRVVLEGTYGDSAFPEAIRLKMVPRGARPEEMGLRFRSLDLNARCQDRDFPTS